MNESTVMTYTRDMQIERKLGNLLCQSDVLARGWTKKQIADFLPQPLTVKNPLYPKSASPMKLWHRDDVEAGEAEIRFYEGN